MGSGLSKVKEDDASSDDSEEGVGGHSSPSGGGGGFFSRNVIEYVDPPAPELGKPIDFVAIDQRTRSVKAALKTMMKVVVKHSSESIKAAQTIPVSRATERVQVTEEIIAIIKSRQGKKDDLLYVRDNLTEIQSDLALRRASLKMMNHNYANVLVRKIDPIQTNEARTVLKHADNEVGVGEETKTSSPDKPSPGKASPGKPSPGKPSPGKDSPPKTSPPKPPSPAK